jgi:hypothetical protein
VVFFKWKGIYRFFLSFVYICIISSYQEGKVGIPLTGLTLPHLCARTWISNVVVIYTYFANYHNRPYLEGVGRLLFLFFLRERERERKYAYNNVCGNCYDS